MHTSTRVLAGLALLALATLAPAASAAEPDGPALFDDPVLVAFITQALAKRPELAQVSARVDAEKERVPQAGAFPDPMLQVGIQNDGFRGIAIGSMPTSYVSIMASQTLPWFGKRALRSQVVQLGVGAVEADKRRAELSVTADVARAYVDLLLLRDQLKLLMTLDSLWRQSEELARVRYESGDGAQSDLLRAQLERGRLAQRRFALAAEERRRVAVLNRLRGAAENEAVPTPRSLADLPDPVLDPVQAVAEAEAQSPELQVALIDAEQSKARTDLAHRELYPDVTLGVGVMVRGALEPMWQATVGVNLPVFAGSKQSRAVAEGEARERAAKSEGEAIRALLRQRIEERAQVVGALRETNRLYRGGLLVQSEATVSSTLTQYQVGRVTFASVLDAIAGYVNDYNGFLESVAEEQRVIIAQRELNLAAVGGAVSLGLGGAVVPGTGSIGAAPAGGSAPASGRGGSTGSGMGM